MTEPHVLSEQEAYELNTAKPPRMNAARVLQLWHEEKMAQLGRSGRVGDTKVSFTRNAKGETQISVEAGAPVGTDTAELDETMASVYGIALVAYERACRRFPTADGTVTNDQAPRPMAKDAK